MNFEITRVCRHWFPGDTRDIVGEFDANTDTISIRRGTIWRDHATGVVYAVTPSRERGRGITCRPSPFRDALCAAAVAAWEALQ